MKKIVVSAFSLFLLGAVSANAQTTTGGQSGTATQTTTPSATSGATQSATPAGTQSGTQDGTAASTTTDATAAGTGAATGTAAAGTSATGAGTSTDAASTAAPAGTAVALEELPAAVKATLASEKLKTWTPSGAQLVTDASGKEYYSIELKQANQIGTVKLSKEGKPVK